MFSLRGIRVQQLHRPGACVALARGVAVVSLALLVGCNTDNPDADAGADGPRPTDATTDRPAGDSNADAGPPAPASASIGSKGGAVSVVLGALFERVTLVLPAGALAQGETAKLTLAAKKTLAVDHPSVGGAEHLGSISLAVSPESLRRKVELALVMKVRFNGSSLPTGARDELLKDPLSWSERYLLASMPESGDLHSASTPVCSVAPART